MMRLRVRPHLRPTRSGVGDSPVDFRIVVDDALGPAVPGRSNRRQHRQVGSVAVADSWGWPCLVDGNGRMTVAEVVVVCR